MTVIFLTDGQKDKWAAEQANRIPFCFITTLERVKNPKNSPKITIRKMINVLYRFFFQSKILKSSLQEYFERKSIFLVEKI